MSRRTSTGFWSYSSYVALVGLGAFAASCQAPVVFSRSPSSAVAHRQLSAGSVSGQAGHTAAVPITISVGSAMVVNLGATFTAVGQGGAPSVTDKLTYVPTSPLLNPDLVDNTSVPGSVAIGYVSNINPALTGTRVIGTVMVPIPAAATTGSYQVQALNVSGLDPNGNDVQITGQSGTITIRSGS